MADFLNSYLLDVLSQSGMPVIIIPESMLNRKKSSLQDAINERFKKKEKKPQAQYVPYAA